MKPAKPSRSRPAADTAEGSLVHRRSDRGGSRMPAPSAAAEDPWSGAARSVTLDGPILGMIATLDVVEVADGAVAPVDHRSAYAGFRVPLPSPSRAPTIV
jgi:hypothetical protein